MKDLDAAVAALAATQHGAFSRRQARRAGGSRSACDRRAESGAWGRTVHRGVFVLAGYPPSWQQSLMAAVLAGPDGTAASHRSAAVLHGLREGRPLEVTAPRGAHCLHGTLVHVGVVEPRDRAVVAGIPTTKVERTLLDLAAVVGDDAAEQAVEAAFRRGLTSPERLRRYLRERGARHGVARLRRALARRHEGRPAGSPLEVKLIQLLRAAGLPDPVRQHEVRIGSDRYFLDLAYPDLRIAIELDGYDPHGGRSEFQRDRSRQNALVLSGWTVLRFTWADVTQRPGEVVAVVTRARAA